MMRSVEKSIKKKLMLFIICILIFSFPVIALANYYISDSTSIDAYPYGMNYTVFAEMASAPEGLFKSVSQFGVKRTVYKNDVKQSTSTNYDNSSPFSIEKDESFESTSRSNSWRVDILYLVKGVNVYDVEVDGPVIGMSMSDSN